MHSVSLCCDDDQLHIARIERESLFEPGDALIPISLAPANQSQRRRHFTAARQALAEVTKRSLCAPVIAEHPILIVTKSERGFSRVALRSLRILQGAFRRLASSCADRIEWIKAEKRVQARKPRPSHRELRIKLHRQLVKTDRCPNKISRRGPRRDMAAYFKSEAAQVCIVSL